jgi:DNA-binding CsgD family transcriptional regulator
LGSASTAVFRLAKGLTFAQIGQQLGISPSTVHFFLNG